MVQMHGAYIRMVQSDDLWPGLRDCGVGHVLCSSEAQPLLLCSSETQHYHNLFVEWDNAQLGHSVWLDACGLVDT